MKLYNINMPEELFKKLDSMQGDPELVMPDGKSFKWSKSAGVVKSLYSALPEQKLSGLEVKMANDEDTMKMIDFLMRGNIA